MKYDFAVKDTTGDKPKFAVVDFPPSPQNRPIFTVGLVTADPTSLLIVLPLKLLVLNRKRPISCY